MVAFNAHELDRATVEKILASQLDITAPELVEIDYDTTRNVLYININGITILRVCRSQQVKLVQNGEKLRVLGEQV